MTTVEKRQKRRWEPTDEQRAAMQERDAQAKAQADAILADPDAVTRMIEKLMHDKLGPNLLSYSLNNQILVLSQAEARAIPVSDVAGKGEWRKRGRKIKGPGLRIVAANGNRDRADGAGGTDAAGGEPIVLKVKATSREAESKQDKPIGFHMTSVWAYSMTEPLDPKAETEQEPQHVANAAAMLLDGLTRQVERQGYSIIDLPVDSEVTPVSNVDHVTKTIWTWADWTARERVVTLALAQRQILLLAAEKRTATSSGTGGA